MVVLFVPQPNGGFLALNFRDWAGALAYLTDDRASAPHPGPWLVGTYHGTPVLTLGC